VEGSKAGRAIYSQAPAQPDADLRQYFPALMDKAALADLLGVSPKTLDRRAASGTGPPRIKIGQKVWFRRQAVIEWLLRNEKTPPRAA
jgi:predicted DNA-binding transcriptional regulator AlpA